MQLLTDLKESLLSILKRQNLSCADKRQLYQYRITDQEFENLKKLLKTSLTNTNQYWNAAFVIYAAEWWRREYDGSSWKWENIFQSFDTTAKDLTTVQRNQIVKTGLQYWRRNLRIIDGRIRYLGTIACEGGLPLNQLNKNSGWLGNLFKQAIPKYIRLQTSGIEAIDIVKDYERIPKTYQNEQIYFILGDMIQTVVALKKQYQLNEQTNPIDYLNKHSPSWREQFPLPMNDDASNALLSGMVKTAAKTEETETIPFRCIRTLTDNYQLKTQFEFSNFIPLEELFSPDKIEKLPNRLDVELINNDKQILNIGCALKTTYKTKPALKMPRASYPVNNEQVIKSYQIRFKYLSDIFEPNNSLLCEEIDNDLPWVFIEQNEQWHMIGTASVRTKAKVVKILYPAESMNHDCDNEIIETKMVGNKKLLKATGIITLKDSENNIYIIKTAQEKTSETYYLQGTQLKFESNPKECYLSLPKLWSINHEIGTNKQIHEQLKARPFNSKTDWQVLTNEKQGCYEIRLQNQNCIQFRKRRVFLLPENFSIRLKPQPNSLQGTIYLENTGHAIITCQYKTEKTENGYQIECIADNAPPAFVSVIFDWQGMTKKLELKIPFPVNVGQIINPEGQIVPKEQPLFQNDLYGFRLRLFNENPDKKRHLQLEFSLQNNGRNNDKELYLRKNLKEKGSVIELAIIDFLEWIKELFSLSNKLDSYIKLIVYEQGRELQCIKISRYQFILERDETTGCIFLKNTDHANLAQEKIVDIKLKALRLSQPEQEHITLDSKLSEQTEIGAWYFYPEKRLAEPWLIYSTEDSSIFLRPILWNGCNEKSISKPNPLDITTLHSAVTLDNTELRKLVIQKILLQMCSDFEHSGWEYLNNLWQQCKHLPLSSFDVFVLLVNYPQVLVALVLKMDNDFITKLNKELPVFWELIPLKHWLAVFQRYKYYLQQAINNDEKMINELIESRINHIMILPNAVKIIARILKCSILNTPDQDLDLMINPIALNIVIGNINEAKKELDRRQANNQWLELLQSELIEYWNNIDELQQQLLNLENTPKHHLSIVLLPIILAVFCVKGKQKITNDTIDIFKLKQLKNFDEEWFNTAFHFALAYLSQQTDYKTKLQQDADTMNNNAEINELETCIQEIQQEIEKCETHVDGLKIDTQNIKNKNDDMELLQLENEELSGKLKTAYETIDTLKTSVKSYNEALYNLLEKVKELNTKLVAIRTDLGTKND